MPVDFRRALLGTPKAHTAWETLTPIAKRDFISWIVSAKNKETRERRISVALSKLLKGDRRPCCYAVVPLGLYKALASAPKAKAFWSTLTPDARRDFADWIEKAKGPDERMERVAKACVLLASGTQHP
jgi:uncharacterized protein YdeI (YjbR/CyaY-like superfamily)